MAIIQRKIQFLGSVVDVETFLDILENIITHADIKNVRHSDMESFNKYKNLIINVEVVEDDS